MPYCMYLRKSRKDRDAEAMGAGETLSIHRKSLYDLAARNGHPISEEYAEIVSGETISARPEMKRLLADVISGKWDGVYVMEIERLARGDTQDQGAVASAFKLSNTLIISPQRTYNPQSDADEEYFEFNLYMSRREFKTINRRQQAGRAFARSEGKYLGSRPAFGYQRLKLPGKGWTLEIVPHDAKIVQNIFKWYADGMGLSPICARLKQDNPDSVWLPKRVLRILENEIYLGKIRWGENPCIKEYKDGQIIKRRIKSKEYELHDGLHPAIISQELWDAVQQARKTRKKIPVRLNHEIVNPLAGLVICSECGHHMIMRPKTQRQDEYMCCNTPGCPNVRSYLKFIEASVISSLQSWLDNYQLPPRPEQSDSDSFYDRLAALQSQRDKLEKQLQKIQTLLETDVYTIDEYMNRSSAVKADLMRTDESISRLNESISKYPRYVTIDQIAPTIRTLLNLYDTLTPAKKNEMLKQCISKIVYKKTVKGGKYVKPDLFTLDIYPAISP